MDCVAAMQRFRKGIVGKSQTSFLGTSKNAKHQMMKGRRPGSGLWGNPEKPPEVGMICVWSGLGGPHNFACQLLEPRPCHGPCFSRRLPTSPRLFPRTARWSSVTTLWMLCSRLWTKQGRKSITSKAMASISTQLIGLETKFCLSPSWRGYWND